MASKHVVFTWQGDIRVIDALLERKKNLPRGKERNADGRTVGILFNGGAQRGALMAGIGLALEDAGLTNLFDHVIGYSIGATCVWYFCSGESHQGAPGYYREVVEDDCADPLRLWRMFDLKILEHIIRHERPIDIDHLRAFPGKIHIGLTDAQTGKGTFVDPRTFADPLAPVIASCAFPFLDGRLSVSIGDKRYVDGGVAWPFPVRYCMETLQCTDLLVLMTHPLQPARETAVDRLGDVLIPFFYSRAFAQAFHNRLEKYNENVKYLTASGHGGARICTLYPQHGSLSMFSKNEADLKGAERASKEFMRKLIELRTN